MTKTQKSRKKLYILLAAAAILLGVFLFGGDGLWGTLTLKRDVDALQARVDSIRAFNAQVGDRVKGLKEGDLKTIEEEARGFNMVKPGEKVYIMAPEGEKGKGK